MIDEVYLLKHVAARGGQVSGFTDGYDLAATGLCFTVKSLSSSYKDMVAMFLIKNLRAKTQKTCFDKVMALLHEVGFNVVVISVYNALADSKFFKDFLCSSTLENLEMNLFTGGQTFLIFDPTHIIKNIHNNFCHKKLFNFQACLLLFPMQLWLISMTLLQYTIMNVRGLLKLCIA